MDKQDWDAVRARAGQPPLPDATTPPLATANGAPPTKAKKPIFAFVIVGINLLFLWWAISTGSAVTDTCVGEVGEALEACETGTAVGTGIAIVFILVLWALTDVILGVLFLVTRRNR